jgi:plasmid stabilization system protein ParE
MSRYVLAPVALADIDEIAVQIAEGDPDAALRFIDDIHETFAFLARHPHAGHSRPDLTDRPVFFWPVRKTYAVIYRKAQPLEIIHVRRWRQDLPTLLASEEPEA